MNVMQDGLSTAVGAIRRTVYGLPVVRVEVLERSWMDIPQKDTKP